MNEVKINNTLLNNLIIGYKKKNSFNHVSNYWQRRVNRTLHEIKIKGLTEFRGHDNGSGIGFADHRNVDIRNIVGKKEKIAAKIFNLPIIRDVFLKQVKLTKKYCNDYLNFKGQFYLQNSLVNKLLKKYKFKDTVNFGAVDKIFYKNHEISNFYLEVANRVDLISKKINLKKINSYCEIGGGFGANLHFLLTNFTNIKKILLIDIFPSIYIQTEYIRYFYKKNVIDYTSIKNMNEIKFKNNNDLEIYCLPNFEIEKIKDKIDHLHNAHSFVEMNKNQIKYYHDKIFKKYVQSASFVFYNRNIEEKTLNYTDVINIFKEPFEEFELPLIEGFKKKNDRVLFFVKD